MLRWVWGRAGEGAVLATRGRWGYVPYGGQPTPLVKQARVLSPGAHRGHEIEPWESEHHTGKGVHV